MVEMLNLVCTTLDSRIARYKVNKITNIGEFTNELMVIPKWSNTKGELVYYGYI